MKKILLILSAVSLMALVGCNRDRTDDANMQREEAPGEVIEREETIDYQDDSLNSPSEDVEVERMEERSVEE